MHAHRGKKHAETECWHCMEPWDHQGQPPPLAAEDDKPKRDLYLSQGHS